MVETQDNDDESQDHQEDNLNRDVNSWVEYSSDNEKDHDDNDNQDQDNDIQDNDIQDNDIQDNGIQDNDFQDNDN